jgi:hypothetical protein
MHRRFDVRSSAVFGYKDVQNPVRLALVVSIEMRTTTRPRFEQHVIHQAPAAASLRTAMGVVLFREDSTCPVDFGSGAAKQSPSPGEPPPDGVQPVAKRRLASLLRPLSGWRRICAL